MRTHLMKKKEVYCGNDYILFSLSLCLPLYTPTHTLLNVLIMLSRKRALSLSRPTEETRRLPCIAYNCPYSISRLNGHFSTPLALYFSHSRLDKKKKYSITDNNFYYYSLKNYNYYSLKFLLCKIIAI